MAYFTPYSLPIDSAAVIPQALAQQSPVPSTRASSFDPPPKTPLPTPAQAKLLEPRTTKRTLSAHLGGLAIDAILFALSALFFTLGIIIYYYHGQPVAQHPTLTSYLIETVKYAPTIFPILFATTVQRATRSCLSWRLERGEKLGLLDLLANCTSVVNALLAQFSLQTVSVTGCLLALLWSLSPIASQASLRTLSIGGFNLTSTTLLAYMDVRNTYVGWVGDVGSPLEAADQLYMTSLLAPTKIKRGPVDTWGNIKIPMIESFENKSASIHDPRWIDIPSSNVTYAALVGIPLTALSTTTNNSFSIETSYWYLDCPVLAPHREYGNVSHKPGTGGAVLAGTRLYSNTSKVDMLSRTSGSCSRDPYQAGLKPRVVVYDIMQGGIVPFTGAICWITTTYVEAAIDCIGPSCSVNRIRRSQKSNPQPGWTDLDSGNCLVWPDFANRFITAGMAGSTGSIAPPTTIAYISNPDDPMKLIQEEITTSDRQPPIANIGRAAFAVRFAQVLNTFWISSIGYEALTNQNGIVSSWLAAPTTSSPNSSPYEGPVANHSTTTSEVTRL